MKHRQAKDESDLIVVNVNGIPKTIKRSPKNKELHSVPRYS